MTERIFKYQFDRTDHQKLIMKRGAKVLSVHMQHDTLMMWARVDDEAKDGFCHVYVRGTGHPLDDIPSTARFVASLMDGPFVWHVFVEEAPA